MMRFSWTSCLFVGLAMCQWQEENLLLRRQGDTLGTLESMGIQLLSSILSPEAASSTASSTTPTSSPSSTRASSTSSSLVLVSATSSLASAASSVSAAAESARASQTALASTNAENKRHRNIAIIVGSVLGALVLFLALALLWFCCVRRRRRNRSNRDRTPEKIMDDDDDEVDGLHPASGPREMAYVTRIESWHEPRRPGNSRNSSMGPPRNSQSRVSLVQRDAAPERFNNGPAAQVPVPIPPPHRASSYGLIQNQTDSMYQPQPAYFDRPTRHSMDDTSRDQRYPGYTPYRSTHSLHERSSTPLFGNGMAQGESTQHQIKRKSVGSTHGGPTAVNSAMNSKDPSPHNTAGTNGPFVPPKSRRRESLPGSPLQHEFDFGWENDNANHTGQARRVSGQQRMPGGWSNTPPADQYSRRY